MDERILRGIAMSLWEIAGTFIVCALALGVYRRWRTRQLRLERPERVVGERPERGFNERDWTPHNHGLDSLVSCFQWVTDLLNFSGQKGLTDESFSGKVGSGGPPDLDPLIRNLKSTTFYGNRLTRQQIASIQETVRLCPRLSHAELARTICEQLGWRTPKGRYRLSSAQRLLTELERLGILTLPPELGPRTAPQPAISAPLADLTPLRLELVREPERAAEFNEWVQRYHPLGYRQPLGAHLRYFLLDRDQRLLGCLLFDFGARRLPCRDRWIGWQGLKHRPHLRLVVRQATFLLLPWVQVMNLASHALARATRQLPDDWERQHGYRPVLLETYVDPRRHAGTCYRASNWQRLGQTQVRRTLGGMPAKTPKDVWAYPLQADWRTILHEGPPPRPRRRRTRPRADTGFVQL